MKRVPRRLTLGAFLYPTGYHVAAWRHPKIAADCGVNFNYFANIARIAENAGFDFLFLPDSQAVRGDDINALTRTAIRYVSQFEPLTLLSALSVVTSDIGLIASMSTTYNEPFHVARYMSSLDHLSGGRAGWNLVTSQNKWEALNFSHPRHPPHAARYARAEEFVDVVCGLWDSWDTDAFVRDKERGIFFEAEGMHVLDHRGEHFSVRGPLNLPRSPQGRPVVCQSGASEPGRTLAARTADVVFTAQESLSDAQAFYADVKERAAALGRPAGMPVITTGICAYVGKTGEEARAKRDELQSLVDLEVGLSLLQGQLGEVDLSAYPLDGPLPPIPESNAGRGRRDLLVRMSQREGLTIRELCLRTASGRGHLDVVGSAQRVADIVQEWFEEGATDGFNVMAPLLPHGLTDFIELVMPELTARGLLRTGAAPHRLRDRLGLPEPMLHRTAATARTAQPG